jgi:hypothetical protein
MKLWAWRSPMSRETEVQLGITDEELTKLAAGETLEGRFPSEALALKVRVTEEDV